jgi:hypothetical protein
MLDSFRVYAAGSMKLMLLTVFDNLIRQSKSSDLRLISMIGHKFKNRTAKSTFDASIFQCNDPIEFFENFLCKPPIKTELRIIPRV